MLKIRFKDNNFIKWKIKDLKTSDDLILGGNNCKPTHLRHLDCLNSMLFKNNIFNKWKIKGLKTSDNPILGGNNYEPTH